MSDHSPGPQSSEDEQSPEDEDSHHAVSAEHTVEHEAEQAPAEHAPEQALAGDAAEQALADDTAGQAPAQEHETDQQKKARLDAALRKYRATLRNEAETGNGGFSADYYRAQKPPHW